MTVRLRDLALLLLVTGLQGCGSSTTNNEEDIVDPSEGAGEPIADGEGPQGDDGESPLPVNLPVEEPTPVGPEGDSGISYDDRHYPLDSALGDIWGFDGQHYNVNFTLANGRYLVETVEVDGVSHELLVPVASSAVVHAELYSPGDQFSLMTYSFSPFGNQGNVLAGNAFFDSAWVGVDEDLSGDVEHDEQHAVVGGTIDFTGTVPDIELHLSLSLANGQLVEGHYTGLFDFTER